MTVASATNQFSYTYMLHERSYFCLLLHPVQHMLLQQQQEQLHIVPQQYYLMLRAGTDVDAANHCAYFHFVHK